MGNDGSKCRDSPKGSDGSRPREGRKEVLHHIGSTERLRDHQSTGVPIQLNSPIKLLTLGESAKCLDIGRRAKPSAAAGHESWSTKLFFERADGPSTGEVKSSHQVKLISEDGTKCLDIGQGGGAHSEADHCSWATLFSVRSLDGTSQLRYGTPVGVFSTHDPSIRLDISNTSNDRAHNSWATQFQIAPASSGSLPTQIGLGSIPNLQNEIEFKAISDNKVARSQDCWLHCPWLLTALPMLLTTQWLLTALLNAAGCPWLLTAVPTTADLTAHAAYCPWLPTALPAAADPSSSLVCRNESDPRSFDWIAKLHD
jgi:hypothetical protein